jgi:membrane protease YdiL (CAAX protease family)
LYYFLRGEIEGTGFAPRSYAEVPHNQMVMAAITFLAAFLTILLLVRLIDKRPMGEMLKSRFSLKQFASGSLLGAGLVVLVTFVLVSMHQVGLGRGNFHLQSMLYLLLYYLFISFYEEFLYRGYLLGYYVKQMPAAWAVVLTAVVFGVMHMANRSFNVLALVNVILLGIVLGLVRLRGKNLWGPIGLHFLWNFMQGPIFGFSVSGSPRSHGIFLIWLHGNEKLTGGSFGPNASLVTLVILLALTGWLVYRQFYEKPVAEAVQ